MADSNPVVEAFNKARSRLGVAERSRDTSAISAARRDFNIAKRDLLADDLRRFEVEHGLTDEEQTGRHPNASVPAGGSLVLFERADNEG